jgi:DNA ligase 1
MNNDSKKKKWVISKTLVNTDTSNHKKYKIITDTTQRKNKYIIKTDKLIITNTRSIITPQLATYDCNRGFMLAESYYDDEKNPTINPIGWWVSEKYDGVRAIWNGIGLYSRNLTQIMAPKWFISQLPKDFSIDGELYIKRNFFNETSGYVRKKDPIDYEWENIRFMAFDVPHLSSIAFEDRIDRLDKILTGLPNCQVIYKVPQIRVESLEQLMKIYQNYTEDGAEGLMLHKPRSPYLPYRCNLVLKLKIHSDEEA